MAEHGEETRAKTSKLTVADTDAWLKKHGNGMDRIQKTEVKNESFWKWHANETTVNAVDRYFDNFDVLIPSDIKDAILSKNIRWVCEEKVRAGEMEKFTTKIKGNDSMRAKLINRVAYRRK